MGKRLATGKLFLAIMMASAACATASAADWPWVGGCDAEDWYAICTGDECSPGHSWRWNNWGEAVCDPASPSFPGPGDNVHFAGTAWLNVGTAEVLGVNITAAGQLNVHDGSHLTVAGWITNEGELWLRYGGWGGNSTLTIPGPLTLSGGGALRSAGGIIDGDGMLGVAAEQTIRGISLDIRAALELRGLLTSDEPAGVISLTNAAKVNDNGTLQAVNDGYLDIHVPITQYGAATILADGGTVRLANGAEIIGGTLESTGTSQVNADNSTAGLTDVHNLGTLTVGNGGLLAVQGELTNDGAIEVYYGGWAGPGHIRFDTPTELGGAGALHISSGDLTGAEFRHSAGHTIHGHNGTISAGFVNEGLIDADSSSGGIALTGAPKDNQGVLRASNGGHLDIHVPVDQSSGTGRILADGGTVRLANGAEIIGGTLESTGTSQVNADNSTAGLTDVHNLGTLTVGNGGVLAVQGGLTNDGTIEVYYGGWAGSGHIRFDTEAYLTGAGAVHVTSGDLCGEKFSQAPDHTIHGYSATINAAFDNDGLIHSDAPGGAISIAGAPKRNSGVLKASNEGFLDISVPVDQVSGGDLGHIVADGGTVRFANGAAVRGGFLETLNDGLMHADFSTVILADVTNDGRLAAGNGGVLALGADGSFVANNGSIATYYGGWGGNGSIRLDADYSLIGSGTLALVAGGVVSPVGARLTNGDDQSDHIITGLGRIAVPLVNRGVIEPGDGVGPMYVDSSYEQSATGTLACQLRHPYERDQLVVAGTATLAGTLRLETAGVELQPGQQFVVLTAAAVTGEFDRVAGPGRFAATYPGNQVIVTLLNALGDMNCDGSVNVFDIDPFVLALTSSDAYASTFPDCDHMLADINCDGLVNAFDIDPFVLCLTGGAGYCQHD